MTKEEISPTKIRVLKALNWLTIEETHVIEHALASYIKLNQDSNSWPIQLARELLADIR